MKELFKKSISFIKNYVKENNRKFKDGIGKKGTRIYKNMSFLILLISIVCKSTIVLATDDPLVVVNNLSDFIFSLTRAIGLIILCFSSLQVGLSFKSHDPSQRANGILSIVGGIIITFSKEIITTIIGG